MLMPTYNEAENLATSIASVLQFNPNVAILVIDDGSPDGTGDIADGLALLHREVSVLHRSGKTGLGKAYLAGFSWGVERGYDLLVEMDADGSHRAEDLPKLLAASPRADLVIGSRWVAGGEVVNWPNHRRWISRIGNRYAGLSLRSDIKDLTAGFRVFRSTLLERLPLNDVQAQGYGFQVEMAWRSELAGAKVVEVPIVFIERTHGQSKMSMRIVIEALSLVTYWGMKTRLDSARSLLFRAKRD